MPSPGENETRADFLDRCMGDDEAVSTFPRADQRAAFCHSQYDRVSKSKSVALALSLDDAGQDAFSRLKASVPSMANVLEKAAHRLAVFGDDLVCVGATESDACGSISQVVSDLRKVAEQINDEDVSSRLIEEADALALMKANLSTGDLARDGGLLPAATFDLSPRFLVETSGDSYLVRDTQTNKVVKSGLDMADAQVFAQGKNIAIRKALGEKVGIFFRLPPKIADGLPSISDRDPSPRHITMLIVGEVDPSETDGVIRAVQSVARGLEPFSIQLTDYGEFKSDSGETIAHLIPRSEGPSSLEEIHRSLREGIENLGITPDHHEGPFKPHSTLAYLPDGASLDDDIGGGTFEADYIEVWGEDGGEIGKVRIALGTGKIEETTQKSHRLSILKSDSEDQHTVFGIVLEPETVDSQGDIYSIEEIEQTAWRFMERYQQFGHQHQELVPTILPLESYIAPVDFEINGQKVKRGTWLLRVRVLDAEIWDKVKSGRLTGFSIGGSAIKTPELAAA